MLSEGSLNENRLSWCTAALCRCNEQWNFTFSHFVKSLSTLANLIDTVGDRPITDLLSHIEGLPALCSGTVQSCSFWFLSSLWIRFLKKR